ncbi:DUF3696 domain-containing protein [Cellulophaga baltica]|uniref:DUF3696 domain-containing protein n=1 Tax=Cellulophaga baltica TaxID=76594 RepID=UPI0003FDC60C|nr:DUF3696 domain-containing protein [Cellulophaga baltica]AIY12554.1 hypothetical protein M667_04690 [Cellulophaga baltica NN016038]
MLRKIGIQNFRVFKEFTEFEIKPLTLLIGPNNSGKSSFTKLLLLLKNGINELDFKIGDHNLEDFSKVLNWDLKEENLKVRFENSVQILSQIFFLDLYYYDGYCTKINICCGKDSPLISYELKRSSFVNGSNAYDGFQELKLDFKSIVNMIYDKDFVITDEELKLKDFVPKSDENQEVSNINLLNLQNQMDNHISDCLTSLELPSDQYMLYLRNIALNNEIDKLDRDYMPYKIFIGDKIISHTLSKRIIKALISFYDSGNYYNPQHGSIFNEFENELLNLDKNSKAFIFEYMGNLGFHDEVKVEHSSLGKILFSEKLFYATGTFTKIGIAAFGGSDVIDARDYYSRTYFQMFLTYNQKLIDAFKNVEYISANRGNQKRVLLNKGESQMDEIVVRFTENNFTNLDYIKKSLAIFEIDGEIEVERFQNYASVFYLVQNDKKIPISDLGFGYSQIVPIILKIVNSTGKIGELAFQLGAYSEAVFIIEEPEANLHPSLQSKIADFLLLTIQTFEGYRFIIETHSEYLIRKLQFLTAQKKLSTSDTVIYYFNDKKYVTEKEEKVKSIEINELGGLTDTFGPGFYDEATNLQFSLHKLNQSQNN